MPPAPLPPDPDRRYASVPPHGDGQRLDKFLAEHFAHYSRRKVMQVLKTGSVRVNGRVGRGGQTLHTGDRLDLPVLSDVVRQVASEREHARASLAIDRTDVPVLYRDDDLLVVNKPPGLSVHGGAGMERERTLIDVLRTDVLSGFGLVHRLDKDTSGAVALVRGEELRALTSARFAADDGGVLKVYEALVRGVPTPPEGEIALPLLPPPHRGKARVDEERGKPALTRYRTREVYVDAARLDVEPVTGRTHQIRVHLAAIGHPLLVDPYYARRSVVKVSDPRGLADVTLRRTPLHAARLVIPHPRTGVPVDVRAPLPPDMKFVEELLRIAAGRAAQKAREATPAGPRPGDGPSENPPA